MYRWVFFGLSVLLTSLTISSAALAQSAEQAAPSGSDSAAPFSGEQAAGSGELQPEALDEPAAAKSDGPAAEARAEETCVPSCRNGYSCAKGVCVSDCNPPCPSGAVCTAGGRCETRPFSGVGPTGWSWPSGDLAAEKRRLTEGNHDGFYLRYSAGVGYLFDALDAPADASIEGVGAGIFDLLIGGTPGEGFVLGGGVTYIFVPEPRYRDDLAEFNMSSRLRLAVLGPFIDYYPDAHSGLHLGATIGLGLAYYRMPTEEDDRESADDTGRPDPGIGVSPMIGYDFWIDEQLSLGIMARLIYIAADDEYGAGHTALLPMLSASVVYH